MFFSRFIDKNSFFPIVASIIISSLVADTLIAKIYVFTTNQAFSSWRLTFFIIISIIFVVGQYLILEYVKKRINEIRSKKELNLKRIHKVVTIFQYAIAIIVVVMILQVVINSQYYNIEITVCATISYGLSIILLSILALRFFSWFKVNRNTVILLYAISSVTISVNACLTIIYVDTILIQQPTISRPHSGPVYPTQFLNSQSLIGIISHAFIISSIIAFLTFWLATSFLLRHYSDRLGRVKYWTILSIPLVYFILQFLPTFVDLFSVVLESNPILVGITYTVIFTISKPVGGILFGIAFWFVARSLQRNSKVRRYFIMASFGIILLFTSNQAVILVTFTYPAFGLVTVSTFGLSSYLLFLGIYASAISAAQDEKLRHSIRKFALKDSKLLDSIGSAQKEQELERTVMRIIEDTSETLKAETGIEASFEKQDLIEYAKDVIREIKNKSSS